MKLLFAHGWALDASLWTPVLAALGQDAEGAAVLDAGYYGAPSAPPLPGGRLLGVGQSLGALQLLARPPAGLVGVVVLDGFARFGRAEDFPQGVPARVLARMRKRLAEGALTEFVARAGCPPPPGIPDLARLQAGLDDLEHLDGRACRLPVFRLHAEDDPIALLAPADASFAGLDVRRRRLRHASDHLSPRFDPQGCAALIRAALKALARGHLA